MTATTTQPTPPWTHAEAMVLAEEAYQRLVDVFADLDDGEWDRPTDCDGWTVRDLAGHVLGSLRSAASIRELVRQQREAARRAKADGASAVDHMTALQVEDAAELTTSALVDEARALVGPATAGRRRAPLPVRRFARMRVRFGTFDERWTVGYMVDVILTRDAWLHRIDLCRAVGRQPELTPEHDGRIVADVADEWARRHGQPFHLVLTGPAGGRFGDPAAGEPIQLDAVELCRILSGRSTGTGHPLLSTEVPF